MVDDVLTVGQRLGVYEILGSLGAGGMGEVYRSRDTKLHRTVAIKVLPELMAGDPERLGRFTREAQALAALNHPHIATIYGVEESGGIRALVMELVEGEDLSAILARGPMPVTDALPIARQIADALDAAHEQLVAAGSVSVIGGGAAAVGAAANLALAWPETRVGLYYPGERALQQHHARVWESVRATLTERGVSLHAGHRAVVPPDFDLDQMTTGPVEFSTGQPDAAADLTIWAI